jgi:hypothetical protein
VATSAGLLAAQTIMKIKSFKREIHVLYEYQIKHYKNIDFNKTRPVLVISDSDKLGERCLTLEMSSHKIDNESIFFYKYFSKKYNKQYQSYLLPNRINTINRHLFNDKNKIMSHHVNDKIKILIKNKLNEYLED